MMARLILLIGGVSLFLAQAQAQDVRSSAKASMNPDISINALMLHTNSNRGNYINSEERNGPALQEAELQFFSDVDPYTKLSVLLSLHQEPAEAPAREGEWALAPEELFIDTTQIPYVGFRVGKFKTALGKHNLLHTHAFPFIDAPLANTVLLGEEGMNDVGVSASILIPAKWFLEYTLQVVSGRSGEDYFNNQSANTNAVVSHLKNLWDLSDDATVELGLSGAVGANEFAAAGGVVSSGTSEFRGADLTFKWRPMVDGTSRALIWSSEYLQRSINRPDSSHRGDGYSSWLQYQLSRRWWVQARGEYLEAKDTATVAPLDIAPVQRKYSVLVGYFPSEFSGARLQYSELSDGSETPEKKVYLQLNFTIGAHPAHSY